MVAWVCLPWNRYDRLFIYLFDLLLIPFHLSQPQDEDVNSSRSKRQVLGNDDLADCDFKVAPTVDLCGWTNMNFSAFKWLPSSGSDAFWIGGPKKDQTDGNTNGGYAFFETSQLPDVSVAANTVSAMLSSPILESTGSKGHCVTFRYEIL